MVISYVYGVVHKFRGSPDERDAYPDWSVAKKKKKQQQQKKLA